MITKQEFGILESTGEKIFNYTMKNRNGMTVVISEFGGTVVSIRVPDKFGRFSDVAAGYDSLRDYVLADGYLGALVGRTANRIANGKFTLDGKEYSLYCNNGKNSLHGGKVGYSYRIWNVRPVDGDEPKLILTLHSPDGEEGYPGNLDVTVTYTLLSNNALSIHYEAVTDKRTPVCLTNHTYFNLGGYASGLIHDHVLQINADTYLPTDETQIPTGEIRPVDGTVFDFREPKRIGQDIDADDPDLKLAGGYDHCFCFAGGATKAPERRIMVYEPNTGRAMTVYTDQPAVQFYSGNYMDCPEFPQKGGFPRAKQTAFCLETQTLPDTVNRPEFGDITLNPGETYTHNTIYQFSIMQ